MRVSLDATSDAPLAVAELRCESSRPADRPSLRPAPCRRSPLIRPTPRRWSSPAPRSACAALDRSSTCPETSVGPHAGLAPTAPLMSCPRASPREPGKSDPIDALTVSRPADLFRHVPSEPVTHFVVKKTGSPIPEVTAHNPSAPSGTDTHAFPLATPPLYSSPTSANGSGITPQ